MALFTAYPAAGGEIDLEECATKLGAKDLPTRRSAREAILVRGKDLIA